MRDGIAKHSKGKRGAPVGADLSNRAAALEGQVARVAAIIAYVNHDIDDAIRASILCMDDLPSEAVDLLGHSSSERIGRLVSNTIRETMAAGLDEIRMSDNVLEALLSLRAFLFETVYEDSLATIEFRKAAGILGGLWEKIHEGPEEFLDRHVIKSDGVDVAAMDFLAGMTDRFAINLYESLFIPRPWVET